jgi:hypothetical protein
MCCFPMKEIKIRYNAVSARRQELIDRMQLLLASISIIAGYSESLSIYRGIAIVLPIIGFFIVFLNILFAGFYRYFVHKYGNKFETILIRANGIVMLITGIGFHITGSKYIQYVYYLLTIIFFIILPNFILPLRNKRMVLTFAESELIVQKRLRVIKIAWKNIELISIQKSFINIRLNGEKQIKKYFIDPVGERHTEIMSFLENLKTQKGYNFEIQRLTSLPPLNKN